MHTFKLRFVILELIAIGLILGPVLAITGRGHKEDDAYSLDAGSEYHQFASINDYPIPDSDFDSHFSLPSQKELALNTIPKTGIQKRLLLLCSFNDFSNSTTREDYFQIYSQDPGYLGAYFREVSNGKLLLDGSRQNVRGWYSLPKSFYEYQELPTGERMVALLKDCTSAADSQIHFPDYHAIDLVFNSSAFGGYYYGVYVKANLDGVDQYWPATFLASYPPRGIWAHEIGHNLSWSHSIDKDQTAYSNRFDIMGRSSRLTHPIAIHKYDMGWIAPQDTLTVYPGQVIEVEIEQHAVPVSGEPQLLFIQTEPDQVNRFSVEARHRVGFDKGLPNSAVVIQGLNVPPYTFRPVNEPGEDEPRYHYGWRPGDKFVSDDGKAEVCVVRQTEVGFKVKVASNISIPSCEAEAHLHVSSGFSPVNGSADEYEIIVKIENFGAEEAEINVFSMLPTDLELVSQSSTIEAYTEIESYAFDLTSIEKEWVIRLGTTDESQAEKVSGSVLNVSNGGVVTFKFVVRSSIPGDGASIVLIENAADYASTEVYSNQLKVILNANQIYLPILFR